ncbi:Sbal_3080 family lipoprotein [Cupriavidus basilensis]|uniref:Sbal_3080 family lipoprotein n=1 Tax=Cupriavidus basilensis TaxID=68895 RepID=A0ABT6AJX0_9BURK|nr:Sbal_3080 family lipoprotein [Cupriavidus basilensis]MDF3832897.1 Sbal_3080 family lipoprotein [Cupriavidus basilensis]
MKKALLAAAASLGLLATGCATYQSVVPVDRGDRIASMQPADGTLFCVISNPVGNAYVEALRDSVQQRGFEFKALPPGSSVASCPYTATFFTQRLSYWRDFLGSAEIIVYVNGERAGKAYYDALRSAGGLNLSNLVPPEMKIEELVEQLLPGMRPKSATAGAGGAGATPAAPV